jgi:hypothetical protein
MGTNYYVAEKRCKCCGRYDKKYHIGKSSAGWAFSFQGYRLDGLTSWKDYKKFLKDQEIEIIDEYGNVTPYEEFVEYIEGPKAPGYVNPATGRKNLVHNEEGKKDSRPWFEPGNDWDDDLGYSFTKREFF